MNKPISLSIYFEKIYNVLQKHPRLLAAAIVLIGILFALPLNFFTPTQTLGSNFNTLDGSWRLEIPGRLQWNEWAGRDFVFTYGPLYQLTHALGLLVPSHDVASLLRFHEAFECVLVMLLVWVTLRTSQAPLLWRASSYALWAFLYSFYPYEFVGLKPIGAACIVTLCAYTLSQNDIFTRKRKFWKVVMLGSAAPVALLYAFDMGICSLLALLLVSLVAYSSTLRLHSEEASRLRRCSLGFLVTVVGGFVIFCVAISVLPGWQNYQRDSLELARAYVVMLPMGISSEGSTFLSIATAISVAILIMVALHLRNLLKNQQEIPDKTLALLGLACFSLLSIRSGLTRSDSLHIVGAISPCVLCLLLLNCSFNSVKKRYAQINGATLIVFISSFCFIFPQKAADTVKRRLHTISQSNFAPAHLEIKSVEVKGALEVAQGVESPSLVVWPFQTIVNLITRKQNPVYTLQSYAAVTPNLESVTISRMKSTADLPTVYIYNGAVSSIDGVEELTRSSLLFRYILKNYEATNQKNPVAVLLRKRPPERLYTWRKVATDIPKLTFQPLKNPKSSFNLVSKNVLYATDFLLLQMNCTKTNLLPIGKPGQLTIEFTLSDGQQKRQIVLLPPDGRSHEIFVCPTLAKEPGFLNAFAAFPQPPSQVRVQQMSLKWQPLDALTVSPTQITVERVFKWQPMKNTSSTR